MSDYYWQRSLPTITQMKYILQIYYRSEELADGTIRITCTNLNEEITEHRTFIPSVYYKALIHTLWRYYLLIDLHVHFKRNPYKKHDPDSVNYFRARCPINIERIKMELGCLQGACPYKVLWGTILIGMWKISQMLTLRFCWTEAVEWYSRKPDPAWISKWVPWVEIDGVGASMESTGDADEGNVGTGAGDDEAGGTGAGSEDGDVPMGGVENSDPPPSNQASSMMSVKCL
ncbi:hypothetical protein BKA82DRAFT_4011278 [Pisolithus tinctorius]|nr:hypothetical protein BKA82DRAFT_4011278 [Pisolithus tinctorius]